MVVRRTVCRAVFVVIRAGLGTCIALRRTLRSTPLAAGDSRLGAGVPGRRRAVHRLRRAEVGAAGLATRAVPGPAPAPLVAGLECASRSNVEEPMIQLRTFSRLGTLALVVPVLIACARTPTAVLPEVRAAPPQAQAPTAQSVPLSAVAATPTFVPTALAWDGGGAPSAVASGQLMAAPPPRATPVPLPPVAPAPGLPTAQPASLETDAPPAPAPRPQRAPRADEDNKHDDKKDEDGGKKDENQDGKNGNGGGKNGNRGGKKDK